MALKKVEICGVNTSKLPVLSEEEKEELFEKLQKGDMVARAKYIYGNLRLVLSVIQRFSNRGESPDDIFQVGCIGLIKAIDNFDTSHNVKFSTYAVPMIIGEIRRYLRDYNPIRVSRSMRDTAYKALQAREMLTNKNNKEPTLEEIKNTKIEEISKACNFNIVHGAYMEVDGEMQLFSYKPEDQSNLISALQLSIATQMSMPYHADGENCRLFTPEEITTLYVNEMTNLTHHQTYTNQMKMYINSLDNKEEIEAIYYGVELTGEYLDTYNMIMEQSKLVVKKYLETLTGEVAPDENGECTKTDEDTDLGFTESDTPDPIEGEGESANTNSESFESTESTENTGSENTETSENL